MDYIIDERTARQLAKLHKAGKLDVRATAAELGVHHGAVYRAMKRAGYKPATRGPRTPQPGLCACGCGDLYSDSRHGSTRSQFARGHANTLLSRATDALLAGNVDLSAELGTRYAVATLPSKRRRSTDTTLELDDLHVCMCGCEGRPVSACVMSGHSTRLSHNLVHALNGSGNTLRRPDGNEIDPETALEGWKFRVSLYR